MTICRITSVAPVRWCSRCGLGPPRGRPGDARPVVCPLRLHAVAATGENAYRIGCRPAFPATIRAFSPCRSPTARSAQAAAIVKPTKLEGSDGTIEQPSIESRERGLRGFACAASAQACAPRQSPAQTGRFNSGTAAIGKMKRHCRLFIHRISGFQYPSSLNRIIYRLNE